MSDDGLLLDIQGLTKRFPGVLALDNVDFAIKKNSIHVLVGENGAGKSTMVNIVTGAYAPDEHSVFRFAGNDVVFQSPKDSLAVGITAVQQHFSLVPDLTIAENVFLNREPKKPSGLIDFDAMNSRTHALVQQLGVDLNPKVRLRRVSTSDRQVVEICKAISREPKLLLMDEPTSGLNSAEIDKLFGVIKRLTASGLTILYISHRLEEVFEIGETVTVLRNGKKVAETALKDTGLQELTTWITGQDLEERFPKEEVPIGDVLFEAKSVSNSKSGVPLRDINFQAHRGEIVAFYGILGSGKDNLAHTLFGLTPATAGELVIQGESQKIDSPRTAIRHSIGYLTEDRSENGYIPYMSVKKNQTLSSLKNFCKFDFVDSRRENKVADEYIEKLRVRTPSRETYIKNLSGGNQQKVIFAKWLIANSQVLILSEPTRGIDIGAKAEMFKLMVEQAKSGATILFFSSELDEVVGMADRILVMRDGRIVHEFGRSQVTKAELLACATQTEKKGA